MKAARLSAPVRCHCTHQLTQCTPPFTSEWLSIQFHDTDSICRILFHFNHIYYLWAVLSVLSGNCLWEDKGNMRWSVYCKRICSATVLNPRDKDPWGAAGLLQGATILFQNLQIFRELHINSYSSSQHLTSSITLCWFCYIIIIIIIIIIICVQL
jgi:hypothetical protein